MKRLDVKIVNKDKEYPIFIGDKVFCELRRFILKEKKHKKIVIITDHNVKSLYSDRISEELKPLKYEFISVFPGEKSKSRKIKEKIENILLDKKYGRDTLIISLGGGVIGDLAGFIAATFKRGVSLINIPTTLLAMSDASIGGKNAINTKHGKNMIGTFLQPDSVFIDISFLDTLPAEELMNGLIESIKMSVILDKDLFYFIETNLEKILSRDKITLFNLIVKSIKLKKYVFEKDPFDLGLRHILNFGHSFGHAYELYTNYKVKHGFSVSLGMIVESQISVILGLLPEVEKMRIINLLRKMNVFSYLDKELDVDRLLNYLSEDKKNKYKRNYFVIIKSIGQAKKKENIYSFLVEKKIVREAILFLKNEKNRHK
ncbi:MAG: 3-dehydroquinate synthase [archaeon]